MFTRAEKVNSVHQLQLCNVKAGELLIAHEKIQMLRL
jgi:hypothetical protein